MPKPARVIVAVALLFCTGLAALAPQHAEAAKPSLNTLLQNPDFERGLASHPWMPSGWDTSMAEEPTVFFGRDSFLVHAGKWAVNVANMSGAFPMAHNWSQTLLVGPPDTLCVPTRKLNFVEVPDSPIGGINQQ